MQQIVSNYPHFLAKPLGPMHKCINKEFHDYLPQSFLHYYILSNYEDASEMTKLFTLHNEHPAGVIVYPHHTSEIYADVLEDPQSSYAAIRMLQQENPVIANVLIDHFEAHKISMYLINIIIAIIIIIIIIIILFIHRNTCF